MQKKIDGVRQFRREEFVRQRELFAELSVVASRLSTGMLRLHVSVSRSRQFLPLVKD